MDPQSGHDVSPGDTWRPLLTGETRERALSAIEAIAESLRAPDFALYQLTGDERRVGEASITGGTAGLAILYAYLDRFRRGFGHQETGMRFLRQSIDALEQGSMRPHLFGGCAGIAWSMAHLLGWWIDEEEDPLVPIDHHLQALLDAPTWTRNYDLTDGLVGLGVYALERLPGHAAQRCLELVVRHLHATAEEVPGGLAWRTQPAWLSAEERTRFPNGFFTLGLAHGVAGAIALLGHACASNVARSQASSLLHGAVPWLLSQQSDAQEGFPFYTGPDVPYRRAFAGWCHGDPGIALALLAAARGAGEPSWEQRAILIAQRACRRTTEEAGVRDACLCHGAAGLGHALNRIHQATGDPILGQAAATWFARALAWRGDGGIGGFSTWGQVAGGRMGWQAAPGLHMGAAGVALSLLAAGSEIEPRWDRFFLMNVPRVVPEAHRA